MYKSLEGWSRIGGIILFKQVGSARPKEGVWRTFKEGANSRIIITETKVYII